MECSTELLMFLTFGFIISFRTVRASESYFYKCANLENRICTKNLIWTVTGIRNSQCFLKCLSDNMCKAVFYSEMTRKCQGHSSAFESQDTCTFEDGSKCYQKCHAGMPVNCRDIQCSGQNVTGIYTIYPDPDQKWNGVSVRCDMDKDGGGWTVLQRRVDGSVNFFRNWTDYKYGFGNASTEYWIGLDTIHKLTSKGHSALRVDLITPGPPAQSSYAAYFSFSVGDERSNYLLKVAGYWGAAGDSLSSFHSNMMFSTLDRDNDKENYSCALECSGAWWYNQCTDSNLNGIYGSVTYRKGITWYSLSGSNVSMTFSEMKIK